MPKPDEIMSIAVAILAVACSAFLSVLIIILLLSRPSHAHSLWADGSTIPSWVKSSCCGPADAHLLGPEDYWLDSSGFHIRGITTIVPLDRILPSLDGQVWAFYDDYHQTRTDPPVYCVFYSGGV